MRPSRVFLPIAAIAAFAGCGSDGSSGASRSADPATERAQPSVERNPSAQLTIPFAARANARTIEADLPEPVRVRRVAEQREALARARAAARIKPTAAGGCVADRSPAGRGALGPPAPRVHARGIGRHVEILFDFRRMPRSLGCRPESLTLVVYSGRKASSSFNSIGSVADFHTPPVRGRAVVSLPMAGRAPFRVIAMSSSAVGHRGPSTEQAVRCARLACAAPDRPASPQSSRPPLRGVTREQLERSFRYVVEADDTPPRGVACSSLRECEVTRADPDFPRQEWQDRYAIGAQTVAGCWSAALTGTRGELPYGDAGRGVHEVAGCVDWAP